MNNRPKVQDPRLYAPAMAQKEMDKMKGSVIPNAEELLRSFFHYENDESYSKLFKQVDKNQILAFGKQFAKLHVQAALEAAERHCYIVVKDHDLYKRDYCKIVDKNNEYWEYGGYAEIDKDSILNSYPLDKII